MRHDLIARLPTTQADGRKSRSLRGSGAIYAYAGTTAPRAAETLKVIKGELARLGFRDAGESGKPTLKISMRFTTTDIPVRIVEVRSGCGCTVPAAPEAPVAPGASGVIPVIYTAGERQGRQSQAITVRTGDGQEINLVLVAELPQVAAPSLVASSREPK